MESTRIGAFLKESRVPGSPGNIARKITVKLYGKGVFAKQENRPGSENTMYYTRRAGQFIYSKLDFLNGAFGIIPDTLDSFETTVDLPCFDFIGDKVSPDWFLHYVSCPDFYAYQGGLGNGGRKARRISPDDFLELEIDLPPLPEQKKIAEILSGIDNAIERTQSANTRIYNAIQGIRDQTQSGEGEIERIGDLIARISTGVSVNGENRPCRSNENGILKVSCVSKGIFFPSENKVIEGESRERATMSIKKGMLLMSRANTPELVGACGITTTDHDNLFLPDKIWNLEIAPSTPCEKNWLNNTLNSQITRSRVRGASTGTSDSMRNISQSNFCEIEILVPPMRIQQEQANLIDSLQKKREAIANKLARYLMLKNALSSDLLSGRKRVSI